MTRAALSGTSLARTKWSASTEMKRKLTALTSRYSKELWFCFYVVSFGLFPLWAFIDMKFGFFAKQNGVVGVWDTTAPTSENIFSWILALFMTAWFVFMAGVFMELEREYNKKRHWIRAVLWVIFAVFLLGARQQGMDDYNSGLRWNEVDNDCSDYIGNDIWVGDYDPDGLDRDGDGWGCESYGG